MSDPLPEGDATATGPPTDHQGPGDSRPWSRFTAEQMRAAFLVDRPVVSSAAAGSGKTQVLAVRYCACLLRDEQLLPPAAILAITFTRAAAAHLRARIATVLRAVLGPAQPSFPDFRRGGGDQPLTPAEIAHLQLALAELPAAPIGTVDGFFLDLVSEHADRVGRDPGLRPPGGQATDWDACQAAAWSLLREEAVAAGGGTLAPLVAAHGETTVRKAVLQLAARTGAQPAAVIRPMGGPVIERLLARRRPELARLERVVAEARAACASSEAAAARNLRLLPAQLPAELGALLHYLRTCSALETKGLAPALKEAVREVQAAVDHPARAKAGAGRADKPKRLGCASLAALAEYAESEAQHAPERRTRAAAAAAAVGRFRELLAETAAAAGVCGFDSTAHAAFALVREPATARALAARYRHVLLDEAQDLSRLQGAMIETLAGASPPPRVFTVGDHRQSIYSFRFAEPAQFARWEGEVEAAGGAHAPLGHNFRSAPALVEAVRGIFSVPELAGAFRTEEIRPGREPGAGEGQEPLECWMVEQEPSAAAGEAEARLVAQLVADSLASGRAPGDHAVLLRTRRRMRLFADALERAGIPVDTDFPVGLYHAQEVWDVASVLRLCLCPHDRMALACAVGGPWGVEDPQDRTLLVTALGAEAAMAAAPVILAATSLGGLLSSIAPILIREGPAAAIRALAADPRLCRRYGQLPLARRRIANLAQLAEEFQDSGLDTLAVIERLEERRRFDIDVAEASGEALGARGVRLMSIHGAKGLEWPVVFLPGLEQTFLQLDCRSPLLAVPAGEGLELACGKAAQEDSAALGYLMVKDDMAEAALSEEARLFYVACTRAVSRLVLVRTGHGGDANRPARCCADWIESAGWQWHPGPPSIAAHAVQPRAVPVAALPRLLPPLRIGPVALPVQVRALTELVSMLEPPRAEPHEREPAARELGIAIHALLAEQGWGADPLAVEALLARFAQRIDPPVLVRIGATMQGDLLHWRREAQREVREQPFLVELVAGDPSRLVSAVPDLLLQDPGGGWRVIDYKSGASAGSAGDRLQVQLYAELLSSHLDGPVVGAAILDLRQGALIEVPMQRCWQRLAEAWTLLEPRAVAPF